MSIHWAYGIIVVGIILFLVSALSATNFLRGNGQAGEPDDPFERAGNFRHGRGGD
jgi:hypothetical protein